VATVERVARRDRDFRTSLDYGPFHTESGSYNGKYWHQNDNGQTVLDQSDPQAPTPEMMTTRVTRVTRVQAPLDAYVIASLDARGYGQREYVDPVTWLADRRAVGHVVGGASGRGACEDEHGEERRNRSGHRRSLDGGPLARL